MKFTLSPLLVLVALIGSASVSHAADTSIPPISTDKAAATPNFYQLDSRLPLAGRGLCAPTAASDILMYLAYHGYPKLLPANEDPVQAQIDIIRTLGSASYMNTDQQGNTLPGEVLRGVWHYIQQAGYICKGAQYVGWFPVGPAIKSYWTGTRPDLDSIKSAVSDPDGIVLLMLGAYEAGSTPDQIVRINGHMVAVVGYGSRGGGVSDPNALIIHNPGIPPLTAPVQTDDLADNYVTLTPITGGQLTGKVLGLPCDAAGYYLAAGPGIPKRQNSPYLSVVDGAVILKIEKPAAATTSVK